MPRAGGGGQRLFDDDVVAWGSWTLSDQSVTEGGALCLLLDRVR